MYYTKKPITIRALQWDGTIKGANNIIKNFPKLESVKLEFDEYTVFWEIKTLEGKHIVSSKDFIIEGIKDEYYPCKPDIFYASYDKLC